jgi:hypothetical protein
MRLFGGNLPVHRVTVQGGKRPLIRQTPECSSAEPWMSLALWQMSRERGLGIAKEAVRRGQRTSNSTKPRCWLGEARRSSDHEYKAVPGSAAFRHTAGRRSVGALPAVPLCSIRQHEQVRASGGSAEPICSSSMEPTLEPPLAASCAFQYRTAWRTAHSAAANRGTSSPRHQRCGRWEFR